MIYISKKNIDRSFVNRSIFGSLVNQLLEIAKKKSISLIYGVPNNKSYQGYTKNLNFNKINVLDTYSYTLPCLKKKTIILVYLIF